MMRGRAPSDEKDIDSMDIAWPLLVAILFAVSAYMLLGGSLPRMLLGLIVLSNATHLLIFATGRLSRGGAPIIADDAVTPALGTANALPQALILTAIVISFALFAFMLVLVRQASHAMKTDDSDAMRLAEPESMVDGDDGMAS